jgi:hypothetical protein
VVANAVKAKDRIECGVCHKTKGCIQTFAEPIEAGGMTDRKSCSDCDDSDCVFLNPDNREDEKCRCRK